MSLTIYGHPGSQPSRTVFWTCLLQDLPFTLGDVNDPAIDIANRNPRGQVPWMLEDDFLLTEMAAIVCYLADRHDLEQLYPRDLRTRARINQILHMHHSLVRAATLRLMAPHVVKPIAEYLMPGEPNPLGVMTNELVAAAFGAADPLEEGQRVVGTITDFLEEHYFNDETLYVGNTESASVADLVCYAELGQLKFANLYDFRRHSRITRWLEAMSALPHHDTIHAYNLELGDIATRPNTLERFTAAAEAGFKALRQTGLVS